MQVGNSNMAHVWTKVAKASGTSWTKLPKASFNGTQTISQGTPIGLLLALTYAVPTTTPVPGISPWTKVAKASGTTWTKITKAT